MARFYLFLLSSLAILFASPSVFANQEGIAAVVNQDAISMTDLSDRMKLIIISSGLPDTPEIRERLQPQIMNSLIDEQLMMQEAKKRDITVSDEEVEQGFASLAEKNKIPSEQFKKMISGSGVNIATMNRQIGAQMGWSKVIQKVMRPQITVTDGDIDEYLGRLVANKGKEEYLLAEIFLPVETPDQDVPMQQLAAKLANEMRTGKAPFQKVAQQFSKGAGAAQGGDLGWMQQGQLPQELEAPLPALKPGEITNPLRSISGYHLLMLRDKRLLSDENMPSRDEVLSAIGVQRLDRMQRRYLLDLKSSAFIENRVQI
jgi:peptidyl-prolyl cis-trans isomerase SurA